MRDFVARFAEAMDKMLTEKESTSSYGPVQEFIGKGSIVEMIDGTIRHAAELDTMHSNNPRVERELLHIANYAAMAWAKMKGYGA